MATHGSNTTDDSHPPNLVQHPLDPRDAFALMLHDRILRLEDENQRMRMRLDALEDVTRMPDTLDNRPCVRMIGGHIACKFFIRLMTPEALPAVTFAEHVMQAVPKGAEVFAVTRTFNIEPYGNVLHACQAYVQAPHYLNIANVANALAPVSKRDTLVHIRNVMCFEDTVLTLHGLYIIQKDQTPDDGRTAPSAAPVPAPAHAPEPDPGKVLYGHRLRDDGTVEEREMDLPAMHPWVLRYGKSSVMVDANWQGSGV